MSNAVSRDLREAANMLDSEEHRYVERFIPCPNGCNFEYAPTGRLIRTAGPAECEECLCGTAEDENAPHLDSLITRLRTLADSLDTGWEPEAVALGRLQYLGRITRTVNGRTEARACPHSHSSRDRALACAREMLSLVRVDA